MIAWLKRIGDMISNLSLTLRGFWTKGIDYIHRNLVLKLLLWSAALGSIVSYAMNKVAEALEVWNSIPDPQSMIGASGSSMAFLGGLALPLAFCNTVLPLDELFICLPVLFATTATMIGYRFVKSWIPTLSG